MYRFTLWDRVFILVLFCVDYNLADRRDEAIQRLMRIVAPWPEKVDRVMPNAGLIGEGLRVHPWHVTVVEKTNANIEDERHYRFDFRRGTQPGPPFYDFQIDTFTYYFARNLRFVLRERTGTKTLSMLFASEEDAAYFYSRVVTFGSASRGTPLDKTTYVRSTSVDMYDRSTGTVKSSFRRVEISTRHEYGGSMRIFNLSAYANAEATTPDVPVVIFATGEFSIGHETMGKKVMLYLLDHRDTIIVVTLPTTGAATTFYNALKRERHDSVTLMLTVDEMQKFDRE